MDIEYRQDEMVKRKLSERLRSFFSWASFVICVLMLGSAPTILASAGGRVGYYLLIAAFGIYPLGWSYRTPIKVIAALIILLSMYLASNDHDEGLVYQERVMKIKLMADQRQAATLPTTNIAP
jgi:hypothetical protein